MTRELDPSAVALAEAAPPLTPEQRLRLADIIDMARAGGALELAPVVELRPRRRKPLLRRAA